MKAGSRQNNRVKGDFERKPKPVRISKPQKDVNRIRGTGLAILNTPQAVRISVLFSCSIAASSIKPHHILMLFGEDDLHAGESLAQLLRHNGHGGILRVEVARVDEGDAQLVGLHFPDLPFPHKPHSK